MLCLRRGGETGNLGHGVNVSEWAVQPFLPHPAAACLICTVTPPPSYPPHTHTHTHTHTQAQTHTHTHTHPHTHTRTRTRTRTLPQGHAMKKGATPVYSNSPREDELYGENYIDMEKVGMY